MGKIWAFLISLSSIYALVTGRAEQSMNKNEVLKERKQNVYQQSRGNNYFEKFANSIWLKEFNYNINDSVIVICKEDEIIIKKDALKLFKNMGCMHSSQMIY